MSELYGLGMQAFNTIAGMGMAQFNNMLARQQQQDYLGLNYKFNEMAAKNADIRTRRLYADFYSPEALMRQYEAAGLSPSMMFGGTPGQGGMSGAQGAGASGPMGATYGVSLLEAAQAAALTAQANKSKAETANIEEDTELKKIQEDMDLMKTTLYKQEFEIAFNPWIDEAGNETTLYEVADNFRTFDKYLEYVQKRRSELGQDPLNDNQRKVLQSIYLSRKEFSTQIAILSSDKVSSEFLEEVTTAMKNSEFAGKNAEAAVSYLKSNIQTSELTEKEKGAWNRILDKLGEEGDTTRDIIIILGMILNNAASNWAMPQIHTHNNYRTTNYVQ